MQYFTEIREQIAAHKLPAVGCTGEEVARLEASLPRPLPAAYKEFLGLLGRNTAGLFCGNEVEYAYLIGMQQEGHEISSRNGGPLLTSNDFVFFTHQNYSFYVFRLSEDDDPDIFLFIEGGEEFESWSPQGKFSGFVLHMFRKELQWLLEKMRRNPLAARKKEAVDETARNDASLSVYAWAFLGAGLVLFVLWAFFLRQ